MITVAVDTGPLYGTMTGVGRAVSGILEEFRQRPDDISVMPYVVSRRARLEPGTRRLPFPAAIAMATWSRLDRPRADAHLRPADVVHGTNYVVPPTRCPRVVSVYDTWSLRHPDQSSPVVNRAMQVLTRNIRTGAVVHTSSHATAHELLDLFPRATVHVAHLGAPRPTNPRERALIDHGDHTAISLTGVPYVLTVGTIERRKNLPRFIEAFARSRAVTEGLHLVIVGGPGDDMAAVRSTIEALGSTTASRIVVLGRVPQEKLDTLYSHARLVAYPSLDEGFGFPILEAMAHGVPVIGACRGSIPEIAGDAAVLVDPLDLDAMGDAIDRLMIDDELRRTSIDRGLERCSHFTWAHTAESLIGLYRSLVTSRDAS